MRGGLHIGSRLAEFRRRLHRARYFRGHGVHSPFVYDLVRNVFMCKELCSEDRSLYRALIARGVGARCAVELQNLAIHCGYTSFGIDRAEGELWIVTRELEVMKIALLVAAAARVGRTVAILDPAECPERLTFCRRIVTTHLSTTVDNRAYLLLFNNHLPKQTFQL